MGTKTHLVSELLNIKILGLSDQPFQSQTTFYPLTVFTSWHSACLRVTTQYRLDKQEVLSDYQTSYYLAK
jgi:hypothetical protein